MADYYGDDYGGRDEVNDLAGGYGAAYGYEHDEPTRQYVEPVHEQPAPVSDELAAAIANEMAAKLVESSKSVSNLTSKKNSISREIVLPFKWNTGEGIGPSEMRMSEAAIAAVFGDEIDLKKNVYVQSIQKLQTYNSSKFLLGLEMHQIQRKSVDKYRKLDGTSFACLLPPGHDSTEETIFEASLPHSDSILSEYGNVDLEVEMAKLGKPLASGEWMTHENDFFGKLAIAHEHLLEQEFPKTETHPGSPKVPLNIVSNEKTSFVLLKPWQLNKLTSLYKDQVVSKMPNTRWNDQFNQLKHFDHDDTVPFGSASYMGTVSEAKKSIIENTTQHAYVVLRVNLIDQKVFEK